jgi:hypothetical protein
VRLGVLYGVALLRGMPESMRGVVDMQQQHADLGNSCVRVLRAQCSAAQDNKWQHTGACSSILAQAQHTRCSVQTVKTRSPALTAGVVLQENVASATGDTRVRVVSLALQHTRAASTAVDSLVRSRYRCISSAPTALLRLSDRKLRVFRCYSCGITTLLLLQR